MTAAAASSPTMSRHGSAGRRLRAAGCAVAVSFAGLLATACGGDVASPVQPQPGPGGEAPLAVFQPVLVLSGVDEAPVAGANVRIATDDFTANALGYVYPGTTESAAHVDSAPDAPVDVVAAGFLPRSTSLRFGRIITLWPVASDAETQAVREMVYERSDQDDVVLRAPESAELILRVGTDDPGVLDAWRAEAAGFEARAGIRFRWTSLFEYDPNQIDVRFSDDPACALPRWGFCRDSRSYKSFAVHPDRAMDPATIRRVLASWFLGPGDLPGLLSRRAPADDLSPFEAQTIRMILRRPAPNRWPDTDR